MLENSKQNNEKVNIQYLINGLEDDETIDFRSFVDKFIKNWLVFAVSIVCALGIAYLVNKFIQPQYKVNTSLVINEKKGIIDSPSELVDLGFTKKNKNFTNELVILNSTPLIQSALDKLDFRISYFQNTFFGQHELYKSSPFVVLMDKEHPQAVDCKIYVKILSAQKCQIEISEDRMQVYSFVSDQTTQIITDYETKEEVSFGEYFGNNFFKLKILLNSDQDIDLLKKKEFCFEINTDRRLTKTIKKEMTISPSDLESTVAEISMKTPVPLKMIDYLNSLTESYLQKDYQQKQQIAENTIDYIDSQLEKISESLNLAEDSLQSFRSKEKVLDVSMQSTQIFEELKELKKEQAKLDVNLQYVEYIQSYFKEKSLYTDLISPAAMGIEDQTLNSLVEELIKLNIEKASMLDNNQERNPYLQKIDIRISNLRSMISENMEYINRTTNIALNDVNSRIRQLNEQIQKMPETERELLGIERVFNINNNIYTYLLEKKSEAEITKASYQPDIEIAEYADIVGEKDEPIKPKKEINYLIALLLGIIIPVGIFYIKDLLNTTFSTIEEIQKSSPVPVVGEIYHNSNKIEDVVSKLPDSYIAESFRKLNINLKFFLTGSASKAIALTSTISGEGKSFIALNLAHILANNNYKTVLAGFDIRKPKVYASLSENMTLGISDLLSNQANIEDIIQKTDNEFLDIVPAGTTPPNPAELLASNKTTELINDLKEMYDFVIIDTPPVGVVIDGYTLMDKTDLNIFVSRIKYTPKKDFEKLMIDLKNKKLINSLVINDVEADRKTKYGYNYYKVTN